MEQLNLLTSTEDSLDWCKDDWETPSRIASMMADLIRVEERTILEPCAGRGQIVREILKLSGKGICANEIHPNRCLQGRENCPKAFWSSRDFLSNRLPYTFLFDLVITNPPFSLAVEFIKKSLELIEPEGRLLFLLPLDWNSKQGIAKEWKKLDAHIHHTYRIEGRVGYLDKDGIAQDGRQCYDAVFDIRPGKYGAATTYLGEPREEIKPPFWFSVNPPF